MCICVYIRLGVCVCICLRIDMHVCNYACMYVCVCMYVRMNVHVCGYVYVCVSYFRAFSMKISVSRAWQCARFLEVEDRTRVHRGRFWLVDSFPLA